MTTIVESMVNLVKPWLAIVTVVKSMVNHDHIKKKHGYPWSYKKAWLTMDTNHGQAQSSFNRGKNRGAESPGLKTQGYLNNFYSFYQEIRRYGTGALTY